MISLLQRFRVGNRMLAAFGVLLLMMATISATSLYALSSLSEKTDQIGNQYAVRLSYANQVLDANNAFFNHLQAMMITSSQERMVGYNEQFLQARKEFTAAFDALQGMATDPEALEMMKTISEIRDRSAGYNSQVATLALEGDKLAASTIMRENGIPTLTELHKHITALVEKQEAKLREAVAASEATTRNARLTVIVVMVLSLLIAIALALVVTRSLTLPLTRAAAAARELAAGRLDGAELSGGADEAGDVLRAVQETRNSLTTLINGIQEMGRRHDAGEVSFRMDASKLQGEYHTIAELLDAQLTEHIGAALLAGEVANRYAKGDLSVDFPRKPGEKAGLTNAMDNVKASITLVNEQIGHLTKAAVSGDFSVRGDESQFEFGFREMVANLNQLMATADGSLGSLSQVLKSIAAGDLTVRMDGNYEGVFAQMRDDANATVANLTGIVGRIQNATGHINTAATEIATGNQDLSRRTEQQAANLEETAASMEELTSTVRQNAEHARQANQLAIGATDVALSGGKVVGEVVQTMQGIEESSKRIADIISVIDGIAFQTNILALNAAVEAARAGEQGRGFAVVASEVRTLAQRSASAAKEIKDLIDDSVSKVTAGSSQVRKAGDTMEEIVTSVQRVTGIMTEISAASQEQSSGIEQVNQTIVQMDETTQQNAALVEEASAAARAMEEQASQLANAVAVFRIHPQSAAPSTPAPSRNSVRPVKPAAASKADVARKTETVANTSIAPANRRSTATALPAHDDGEWQEF